MTNGLDADDSDDGSEPEGRRERFRWLRTVAVVGLLVALGLQLVPYGRRHSNPQVVQDAPWPNAASEEVARASCYSCHSNETDWPLYSYIAPMSWLVRRDVERGRDELNFSDWARFADVADDAVEVIESGAMPPDRYTAIHRAAKLTAEERAVLIAALAEMSDERDRDHSGDNDHEDD